MHKGVSEGSQMDDPRNWAGSETDDNILIVQLFRYASHSLTSCYRSKKKQTAKYTTKKMFCSCIKAGWLYLL